jgi:hypothetical protein
LKFPVIFILSFAAMLLGQAMVTPVVSCPRSDPNEPVMSFENDTCNFGTITQGEIVTCDFRFKNTGRSPLLIMNVNSSCGCVVPGYSKEPVPPGKTGVVTGRFNSAGKMGVQDKTLTVSSNNRDGMIVLHITGTVKAKPWENR